MKLKILFVCTINKMRSKTAEELYKEDPRFEVMSAGVDEDATVRVNRQLLEWADYIIVMEKMHRNRIRKMFPDIYKTKRIICLYIPDEFDFMDPELQGWIEEKFEKVYKEEISRG